MIQTSKVLISEKAINDVVNVLRSGKISQGEKVREFERAFADYIGVKHAVAVNSGTTALLSILSAFCVKPGDEVIVPAYTFFATVEAVMLLGAKPVFADLNPEDLTICPKSIEKVITPSTKAIIPVHIFGGACDMDAINAIAEKHNLYVVEDCAQAHGTTYKTQTVGSFGIANAFSFYATKHITTIEGGMVTTNSQTVADYIRKYRSHGMTDYNTHSILGQNCRMNEVGAVIGSNQLLTADSDIRKRQNNVQRIMENTKIDYFVRDIFNHSFFTLPAKVANPDEFTQLLKENGIECRRRYLKPLYEQPVYRNRYGVAHLKVADFNVYKIVGLPCHQHLSEDEIGHIIETVNKYVA